MEDDDKKKQAQLLALQGMLPSMPAEKQNEDYDPYRDDKDMPHMPKPEASPAPAPQSSIWDKISQHVQNSLAEGDATRKAAGAQANDRIMMAMNPKLQGPQLGPVTPEENAFGKQAVSAVAGGLAPEAKELPLPNDIHAVKQVVDELYKGLGPNDPMFKQWMNKLGSMMDAYKRKKDSGL